MKFMIYIINQQFILNQQFCNMKSKNIKKPIQLICFDQNKNLKVCQQAIEIFKTFQCSQLHIITVAGKYRTGKSYILNKVLLNQNSGFQVGSTINACTKGLWMWPQLISIYDGNIKKDCLIVDTQGLGSLQQGQNTDVKIFLMAVLLSSYLIYNSVGSIDQKALEGLSLIINLANLIHRENNIYDNQELINSFPSFMWLVRDFTLRLETISGQKMSSQQYLQNSLKPQKGVSHAVQKKNQIRKQLRTFFQERDCFTLIRPTQNQKDLQNLTTLPQNKFRPGFIKLVEQLKIIIRSKVKPKKIRGKSMAPEGFIQLCKYFTDSINSGKLPSINSHWDSLCLNESKRILQLFKVQYNERLETAETQNLEKRHQQFLKQATNKINKTFLGKLQKQLTIQKLQKILNQAYNEKIKKINEEQYLKVKQIIKQIFEQIIKEFKQKKIQSFQQIFSRFQQIKQSYKLLFKDCRLYQQLYTNSKNVFREFINFLEQHWKKQYNQLDCKNNYLEKSMNQTVKQVTQKAQEYHQILRTQIQSIYKLQLQLQQLTQQKQNLTGKLLITTQSKQKLEGQLGLELEKTELLKKQFNKLTEKNIQLEKSLNQIQNQKIKAQIKWKQFQELYKESNIKQRKIQRQSQILKSKCSEYLQKNIQLNTKLEELQNQINQCNSAVRNAQYQNKDTSEIFKDLNQRTQQLQYQIKNLQKQRKILLNRLNQQKQINQTLIKTPQNLNYFALKKTYEIEKKNNESLTNYVKDLQLFIKYAKQFQCPICQQSIEKDFIKQHQNQCNKEAISQTSQMQNLYFDVSYIYNGQNEIQFEIEVRCNQKEWKVIKNIQTITNFLKHVSKYDHIFDSKESEGQDYININQERRNYLDQLINNLGSQIWTDLYFIEFFAIDIHILRRKKTHEQYTTNINQKQNYYRNEQVKKSWMSELEIEIEQPNSVDSINSLFKTSKFTKKMLKFDNFS